MTIFRSKTMYFAMLMVTLIFMPLAGASAADSRSTSRLTKCSGILHKDRFGLHLGGGRGEDEGICVIRKADAEQVLTRCRVGVLCEITGESRDCPDSGECTEFTHITSSKTLR